MILQEEFVDLIFCKEFFVQIKNVEISPQFLFFGDAIHKHGTYTPPNNKHGTHQFGGLQNDSMYITFWAGVDK